MKILSNDNAVDAYNNVGTLIWSYNCGPGAFPLSIIQDIYENVYIGGIRNTAGGDGIYNIWKLNSSGVFLGGVLIGDEDARVGCIRLDSNNNIFATTINDGRVFKISANLGTVTAFLDTNFPIGYALVIDHNDCIYIGRVSENKIYKFNTDLTEAWHLDITDGNTVGSPYSFAITKSNALITGFANGYVRKYKSDGTSTYEGEWEYGDETTVGMISQLLIDDDDNIYIATGFGFITFTLFKITSVGAELWKISTPEGTNIAAISIDEDGTLFAAGLGDLITGYNIVIIDKVTGMIKNGFLSTDPETGYDTIACIPNPYWIPKNFNTETKLVACGNNRFYYEAFPGKMVELRAARDDIDTTKPISLFELFQKIFIVNYNKFKVADFKNIKLTHSALGTAHANGDIISQAGTNAQMVVDFSSSGYTYGIVISGAFKTTGLVTTVGGLGSSFTPSAVTAPPHWYNWTVYPGGSSGSMPNKATWGCAYRARPVLGGNPENPYQWYMGRQGNPWDWQYHKTDAQTAVMGTDADAGKIGDSTIIGIPVSDDIMFFGCSSSIWKLIGDPAEASGSLDIFADTTGIFCATGYCFGPDKTIFFLGIDGLYLIGDGYQSLQNLTKENFPSFMSVLNLNRNSHRVSMVYDKDRHGIIIYKVTLATGANEVYWYDLRTGGIFPESYPTGQAAYSLIAYNAKDSDYRKVILGCKDGYLRCYDENTKNDDGTLINSYTVIGPQLIGKDIDVENEIGLLSFIGADGSDEIEYKLFAEETAEKVIEKVTATTIVPRVAGSVTTFTHPKKIRQKIRGIFAALMIGNSQNNKTWAVEAALSK